MPNTSDLKGYSFHRERQRRPCDVAIVATVSKLRPSRFLQLYYLEKVVLQFQAEHAGRNQLHPDSKESSSNPNLPTFTVSNPSFLLDERHLLCSLPYLIA